MLKIRFEGLMDDVQDGAEIIRDNFDILNASKVYPNRYGRYVRIYLDVDLKKETIINDKTLNKMCSSLNYFIFEEMELDEGYEDRLVAGFVTLPEAKKMTKLLNSQSANNCYCVKNKFGSFA